MSTSLLLRNQVELQIQGALTSDPVTKDSLAKAREQWQEIRDLLKSADQAGRKRDYRRAGEIYRELRKHPKFELNAIRLEDPEFSQKVIAAFAHNEDWESCIYFLRMFAGDSDTDLEFPVEETLSVAPWLPPELLKKALDTDDLRHLEAGENLTNEVTGKPYYWRFIRLGIKRYREGRYEEALEPLKTAMAPEFFYPQLTATIFAAMSAYRLGDHEQARKWFNEAEADFNQMIDYGEGQLNPDWNDQALIELALKEAREMMGDLVRGE